MVKYRFLLTLVIFFGLTQNTTSYAQNSQVIDSLNTIIQSSKTIQDKLPAYEELLYQTLISEPEKLPAIVHELKTIAKSNNNFKALGKAHYWEGQYLFAKGDFKKAIDNFMQCREYAEKSNDKHTVKKALTFLSSSYYSLENYKKAKQYATELIKKSDNVSLGKVDGYFMQALINETQGYKELAINDYLKADSIITKIKDPLIYDYKGRINNNIALIFLESGNLEKAKYYLEQINKLYTKNKDQEGIYLYKHNIAKLYIKQNNFKKALVYLQDSKHYYQKSGNQLRLSEIYSMIGETYLKTSQTDSSLSYLNQSMKIAKKINNSSLMAKNHLLLGKIFIKNNQNKKAKNNLLKSLSIYKQQNILDKQIETLNTLSFYYEKNKNYKQSLDYLKTKDSINKIYQNQLNQAKIFQLETKYQSQKKEEEIELLTVKNKLIIQQKKTQNTIFFTIAGILILAGSFMFFRYKNKQKTTQKLIELDKTKSAFFANISHEFRTPLTLILSPVNQLLKQKKLKKETKKALINIKRNAERLLELVNQILEINKIDAKLFKLNVTKNNPKEFMSMLCDAFQYIAQEKNINYLIYNNCPEDTSAWFDKDILFKIIQNILSNSFKYTPERGTVLVNYYCNNNDMEITVKNTGKKLSNDDLNRIFDRFYQVNNRQQGFGLGLSIVKELVQIHKGKITIKSDDGWTTFSLRIHIQKEAYHLNEIGKSTNKKPNKPIIDYTRKTQNEINDLTKTQTDKPIILIIDDNNEIRQYLHKEFSTHFRVVQAKDGEEGIKLAMETIPDIIISDVMMPKKDGYEVCKTLKNDYKTSHIPIILLTAKAGDENILKGTLQGANDYIIKPFNVEILKSKVNNLVDFHKKLQKRYKQEIELKPRDISITNIDEEFFNRIEKVLDKHLTRSSFNTNDFAKAANMSRMQLHRKLKALTGLSTTEFIRSQRLKLAAALLKESDVNISEIGYQVGFNSPNYFSTCFKKAYGCSPSEFSDKHKKQDFS